MKGYTHKEFFSKHQLLNESDADYKKRKQLVGVRIGQPAKGKEKTNA